MPGEPAAAGGTLWAWCLEVYALPGVAEACLHLQQKHGANVPLVLWSAWLGARGLALDRATADAAATTVAAWHGEVVEPIRAVRTRLKSGPPPAPGGPAEALRERVKAIELEAERIEIDLLETLPPGPAMTAAPDRAVVAANLAVALAPGTDGAAVARQVAVLADAALLAG